MCISLVGGCVSLQSYLCCINKSRWRRSIGFKRQTHMLHSSLLCMIIASAVTETLAPNYIKRNRFLYNRFSTCAAKLGYWIHLLRQIKPLFLLAIKPDWGDRKRHFTGSFYLTSPSSFLLQVKVRKQQHNPKVSWWQPQKLMQLQNPSGFCTSLLFYQTTDFSTNVTTHCSFLRVSWITTAPCANHQAINHKSPSLFACKRAWVFFYNFAASST